MAERRMRVESSAPLFIPGVLRSQYSGCGDGDGGERPLFARVNVLRWTGWVTAGVFNPKN